MKSTIRKTISFVLALSFAAIFNVRAQESLDPVKLSMGPQAKQRTFPSLSDEDNACIVCHTDITAGIVQDWQQSEHARYNVGCYECHRAGKNESGVFDHNGFFIHVVVSPKNCSACHPSETKDFEESRHAVARQFIAGMPGLTGTRENTLFAALGDSITIRGCQACHGTVVEVGNDGKPAAATWPNQGIGRINPDGSLGACTTCHTRHRFSLVEARKPQVCGNCHIGPDHPQWEIYQESKHGNIYSTRGADWDWNAKPGQWNLLKTGVAPVCVTCHMDAGLPDMKTTHNVSANLSWALQAPLTYHYPDWRAKQEKMQQVCSHCHSPAWTQDYFKQADATLSAYENRYYKPVLEMQQKLIAQGKWPKAPFSTPIQFKFFEYWHHEGRRARFGAFMQGQDYELWDGFYQLELDKNELLEKMRKMEEQK
jgi:hydroxylamine dehydrogenase